MKSHLSSPVNLEVAVLQLAIDVNLKVIFNSVAKVISIVKKGN